MPVIALLHAEALEDSGPSTLTVTSTLAEATVCSSDQFVFGGKSFYFPTPSHSHYVAIDTTGLSGQQYDPYMIDGYSFTVECRIYPLAFSTSRSVVCDLGWSSTNILGFSVHIDPAGQLIVASADYIVPTGVYISLSTWTAIKVTFGSAPNGTIDVAVDGVLVEFSPGANYFEMFMEADPVNLLRIGNARSASTSRCFQGYIDEFRFSIDENFIDTADPATYAVATAAFGNVSVETLFPTISIVRYQFAVFMPVPKDILSLTGVISMQREFDVELELSPYLIISRRVYKNAVGDLDLSIPPDGVISGVVRKNTLPVPYVRVLLYSMDSGNPVSETLADSEGNYVFRGLNKYQKCMVVVLDPDTSESGYGARAMPHIQPI